MAQKKISDLKKPTETKRTDATNKVVHLTQDQFERLQKTARALNGLTSIVEEFNGEICSDNVAPLLKPINSELWNIVMDEMESRLREGGFAKGGAK